MNLDCTPITLFLGLLKFCYLILFWVFFFSFEVYLLSILLVKIFVATFQVLSERRKAFSFLVKRWYRKSIDSLLCVHSRLFLDKGRTFFCCVLFFNLVYTNSICMGLCVTQSQNLMELMALYWAYIQSTGFLQSTCSKRFIKLLNQNYKTCESEVKEDIRKTKFPF